MEFTLSSESYKAFSSFLHDKLGIVLGDSKQYLVKSRLSSIANLHKYIDMDTFLRDVICMKDRELTDACLELMTTNETFWFRDTYPFALLEKHILPALNKQQKRVRIWSSACASGQEPYSIAMTILEYQRKHPGAFSAGVEIIGTDFSAKMIDIAKAGVYDKLALSRGLPADICQRYFEKTENDCMKIKPAVSSKVQFKRFNLLQDFSSLGSFDVVFCRNVLIYFDGKQKHQILKKIAARIKQSSCLFLGAAESISGSEDLFKMHSVDKGLYYTKV